MPSKFPPSFDGNPWSYGFALFSLTLVSAISLAILAGYLLEKRAQHRIDLKLGNWVRTPLTPALTPLKLHRLIVSGFLLTVVMGALPDVLILLGWGELGDGAMESLFLFDRLCDGLLIFPFLFSSALVVWCGPAVEHTLGLDPKSINLRPSWAQLRERLRLVGVVLLIAVGTTVAKWAA